MPLGHKYFRTRCRNAKYILPVICLSAISFFCINFGTQFKYLEILKNMAEVIRMPLLSDTMTEGKIISWNKKVGDKVKSDDVLADVETDKATMEVNGYVDGTLLYIGVPAGEAAKVNQIIAIVGKDGEDYKSLLDGGTGGSQAAAPAAATTGPAATKTASADAPAAVLSTAAKVELPAGAKEIRMPLLSDTMTEGKIVSWNKKGGRRCKKRRRTC